MKKENRRGKGFLRPLFVVILSLASLAPLLDAKERRGAQLAISKKDGTVVKGELLAVKEENLLIMDGSTPGGVTVSLKDALLVKVIKQGKAALILGGVFIGGAIGGATGYAIESGQHGFLSGLAKAAGAGIGAGHRGRFQQEIHDRECGSWLNPQCP
jgi:hypothetical protein